MYYYFNLSIYFLYYIYLLYLRCRFPFSIFLLFLLHSLFISTIPMLINALRVLAQIYQNSSSRGKAMLVLDA